MQPDESKPDPGAQQFANTNPAYGQPGGAVPTQPAPPMSVPGIPQVSSGEGIIPQLPQVGDMVTPAGSYGAIPGKPKKKRTVFIVALVAGLVLIGGSAAAYVAVIVPNQPQNIWKTALTRTASGYDTVVNQSASLKSTQGESIKGSYKLSGQFATDGNVDIATYKKNAKFTFDIGTVTTRVTVEGRVIASANSTNPDIYLRATGTKGMGSTLGDYGSLLDGLDGQWVAIDHTLLDNIESSATKGATQNVNANDFTADDGVQVEKAVGTVNHQYLFTTDPNKAVLRVAQDVGKEKLNGRQMYHYKVGLDKQHTKDYVNAMVDQLQTTPLSKLLNGKKLRDEVDMDAATRWIDNYNTNDTADVYVDTGTKLISDVRITDKSDAQNYLEVGVPYLGGDVVPFVVTLHAKDDTNKRLSTVTYRANANYKTGSGDFSIDFDMPTGGATDTTHETGSAKFTINPNNSDINVQKPDGAKSLDEVLGGMLGGLGATGNAPINFTPSSDGPTSI